MPLTSNNLTFSVTFAPDADRQGGTVTIADTTPYFGTYGIALVDVVGAVNAWGPDGFQFNVGDLNSPDIDHDVSTSVSLNLPLDASGFVQEGDYQFQLWVRVTGAVDPGDYQTKVNTVKFCIEAPVLKISPSVDCLCGIITITDVSDLAGYSLSSRTMTLYAPDPESATHAPISGSGSTVNTSGEDIYVGTYTATLSIVAVKDNVSYTAEYTLEFKSDCDFDLCSLQCCFEAQYNRISMARERGVPGALARHEKNLEEMAVLAYMTRQAAECGRVEKVSEYVSRIKVLGNCSESCTCGDGDGPQRIVPICSPGGGLSVVVQAGTGITVTVVGSTYTVSLSKTTQDILNNVYNTVVTAGNGVIVSGPTINSATIPDTHTYETSIDPDYQAQDMLELLVNYDVSGGIPTGPDITFGVPAIKGSVFTAAGMTVEPIGSVSSDYATLELDGFYVTPASQGNFKVDVQIENWGWNAFVLGLIGPADELPEAFGLEQYQRTSNPTPTRTTRFAFYARNSSWSGALMTWNDLASYLDTIQIKLTITEE